MASNVMNGPTPQTVRGQSDIPTTSGTPQISVSIIQGAHRFTEIFEKRTAVLRADYEERIRALTTQRDALFAASQGQIPQEPPKATGALEVETLRQGSPALLRERADRERERASWEQERAQWTKERAMVQEERVKWNAERLEMEAERARWNEERARFTTERATFEESLLRVTKERDTILDERKRCLQVCRGLKDELGCVQHELHVSKAGYGSLQEQLASKNASVMALETRVQQLEAARTDPSGTCTEAGAPNAHEHIDVDGMEDQQDVFNPLAFICSPARSMTLPTISTQSTRLSLKSPSLDPVSTQVRSASPPLLPFPFDEMFNLSPTFSNSLPPPQSDGPGPRSSTISLQLDSLSSPTKSSVVGNVHDDVLITDLPLAVEESGDSLSATSVITTPPRRLVIRIPPSVEKARKFLKPSPLHFTDEEKRNIVHVPRQPESDDDIDGSDTVSDTARTTQDL